MSRRSRLSDEERIAAVQEYLDGKGSYVAIVNRRFYPYLSLHPGIELQGAILPSIAKHNTLCFAGCAAAAKAT